MPESTGSSDDPQTLADRLNHLFAMARPTGADREPSGKEVAAASGVSEAHVSELRRGIKTNPSIRVICALAGFFDVRPAYLLGEPAAVEEVNAELELRRAMNDVQVHDIAMRAAGLDPNQRAAMQRLLAETIRKHDADGVGGPGGH